ncbi:2-dehydro-3-deoxy-6-phosphogalactonate aldolase [Kiloniella antarctica]|uniref:2-dehydro-3-deoxy-6-phosphogalactonate aldolase n=1 Tax=Kiloniella antarctica TaxID=1550907 RepID=A0ABW5BKS1_9PROT
MKRRNLVVTLNVTEKSEAIEVAELLMEAGISRIEIPLNSPNPYKIISAITQTLGGKAIIGAGMALKRLEVDGVKVLGGKFISSPNCNPQIISLTKELGLLSWPGVVTPSECFSALAAGADGLNVTPASMAGINGFKALHTLLPVDTPLYAVGGVKLTELKKYVQAGCSGFGLGAEVYVPGWRLAKVADKAAAAVDAHDLAFPGF